MRTQVVIIGAGPSGLLLGQLLLGQLLLEEGISNVVLERQTGEHVLGRIRAGIIETDTVELLDAAGVGERMRRESLLHEGIEIAFAGARSKVNFRELIGRGVVVYGQTEITRDLMAGREAAGGITVYRAKDVKIHGIAGTRPRVTYLEDGIEHAGRGLVRRALLRGARPPTGPGGGQSLATRSVDREEYRAAAKLRGGAHALWTGFSRRRCSAYTDTGLEEYSRRALARVWKAERFSWSMTSLLHQFPERSGFDRRIQEADLEYLLSSRAALTSLAENYVGLPL